MFHKRRTHRAKTQQDSHEIEPRRDMELRDSSQDKTWTRRDWAKTETCKCVSRDVSRRNTCLETRHVSRDSVTGDNNLSGAFAGCDGTFFRLLPYSLSSAHPLYITVHSFFSHVQLALSTNPSYRIRLYPPDWLSCAIEHFQIYIRRFNIVRAIPRYEDLDCVKWDISGAWEQFWVRTSFLTPPLTHTVSAGTWTQVRWATVQRVNHWLTRLFNQSIYLLT